MSERGISSAVIRRLPRYYRYLGELLEKDNYENEEWLISAYRTMSPEKQRMLQVYADMLLHYDREM